MVCELYLNLKTLKREERSQTKLLRFHLKLKKRKTKSKENKKKKIVKIRFEFCESISLIFKRKNMGNNIKDVNLHSTQK